MDFAFNYLLIIGAIYSLHVGMYLAGANIYDIKQKIKKTKRQKRFRKNPLLTVVLAAYKEETGILACLDSIRKNSYKDIEVVVVDNDSPDDTRKIVRNFIKDNPKLNIRLVARRGNYGKGSSITYGIKHHSHGELVMTLDADTILDKHAIKNAVKYFHDPLVHGVAANVKIIEEPTVLNLLQRFEHMVGYRSKKFYSVANCEFIIGGVASTYRKETMKKVGYYDKDTVTEDIGLSLKVTALGNKTHRLVYAVDVLAYTEGVQTYKALFRQRYRWKLGGLQNLVKQRSLFFDTRNMFTKGLTFYRLPMAVLGEFLMMLEPLVLVYVVYLSITYRTLDLFVGAYAMLMAYILLVLKNDEHMSFRKKITQSTYAPIIYFVFYIMSLVQVVSIFRCFYDYKKVTLKVPTSVTWVSPNRAGNLIVKP